MSEKQPETIEQLKSEFKRLEGKPRELTPEIIGELKSKHGDDLHWVGDGEHRFVVRGPTVKEWVKYNDDEDDDGTDENQELVQACVVWPCHADGSLDIVALGVILEARPGLLSVALSEIKEIAGAIGNERGPGGDDVPSEARRHGDTHWVGKSVDRFYVRRPSLAEWQRHMDRMTKASSWDNMRAMVEEMTVHPDREMLARIIERRPGLVETASLAINDLAGARSGSAGKL